MNNILTNIEQFFENLWSQHIKPDVNDALDVASAFFSGAIQDAASLLGSEGLQIVTAAVSAAESAGGAAGVKFEAAKTSIETSLKAVAITAPEHIINAAIEGAVSQMNAILPAVNDQTPALPASPAPVVAGSSASVPVTPAILASSVANVQGGLSVQAAAGDIVTDMGGQGAVIAYADALSQLQAAVSAAPVEQSQSGR